MLLSGPSGNKGMLILYINYTKGSITFKTSKKILLWCYCGRRAYNCCLLFQNSEMINFFDEKKNWPNSISIPAKLFKLCAVISCGIILVTFQYVQALLVGRVRLGIVWWAEAATICVSHPVSTVTRAIWPLRRFNPVCCCLSICISTTAKKPNHCS